MGLQGIEDLSHALAVRNGEWEIPHSRILTDRLPNVQVAQRRDFDQKRRA